MTNRIGPRASGAWPQGALPPKKTYSTGGAKASKRSGFVSQGYDVSDELEKERTGARFKALDRDLEGRGAPAKPANPKGTLQRHQEKMANRGYRSGFVLMDLTDTQAHAKRQAAIKMIGDGDASAESKKPGSGYLYRGEKVDASESHISVVRGVSAKRLHPSDVEAGKEKATPRQLRAFAHVAQVPETALQLIPKITYWEGPAVGPKKYRVAAIEIHDPQNGLSALQSAWDRNHGTSKKQTVGMHLTLAYLKLGHDLPLHITAAAEKQFIDESHQGLSWRQQDVVYSGRYGKEFARAKLKGNDPR